MTVTTTKTGVWILDDAYKKIVAGYYDYLAGSTEPGILYTWGTESIGSMGLNTNELPRSSPTQIPGTQWQTLARSSNIKLVVKSDNTLWSWGSGNIQFGELGDNSTIRRSSPVQIPGTEWCNVGGGETAGFAIKTDGTLWSWGCNDCGILGINAAGTHRSSPVQIPGTQWSFVRAASEHAFGLKTDGTLWAWGKNTYGRLGDNTEITRSSPVNIPGNQWNNISSISSYGFARKTDGTLWVWGTETQGAHGLNTLQTTRSSPTQIPGNQWNDIDIGAATKTDGTLWTWGNNASGQLGQNDTIQRSSPTQIPGNQWNDIKKSSFVFARKTDNTLWSWGANASGQLGQNDTIPRSSPVQIPGNWNDVTIAGNNGLARKGI